MKFINFTVVKFSICLALGILAAHFSSFSLNFILIILPATIVLLAVSLFFARNQLFQNPLVGISVYMFFFSLGFANYQMQLPRFQAQHYSHFVKENETTTLQLKIKEILKPDNFSEKYIAEVFAANRTKTNGRILIYKVKDSLEEPYITDDVLLVSTSLLGLPSSLNPHQLDYSKYLNSLRLHHQIRISKENILMEKQGSPTLPGQAERLREFFLKKLKDAPFGKDERTVLEALILGKQRDISKEIYSQYAAAGVIHILSVSGLHVGILYLILSFLFSPIERLPHGKKIKTVAIILCLFGFALVAGWSPPTARSAVMFAFFAFATLINRPTNSINTLFLSFLFLLLINPLWLLNIGFQLSYLALFFILWLQPILSSLYTPENKILRNIWGTVSLTLTAQIGVLPLSLYYFHQFPGLFLVSNLLVIPYVTFLMCGGILVVLLAIFGILPDAVAIFYNNCLSVLNGFIAWVSRQDQFLFEGIHFSELKMVGSYILMTALILLLMKYTYKKLLITSVIFGALLLIFVYDKYRVSTNELIVFHRSRQTLIANKHLGGLEVYKNDTAFIGRNSFPLKSYSVAQNIENYSEKKLPDFFEYNNKTIVVLDSLCIYPKTAKIEIALLTHSPKVNLERFIDSIKPNQIVADGNNYKSYIQYWKKTCERKKIPFHYTGEKGAFVLRYEE